MFAWVIKMRAGKVTQQKNEARSKNVYFLLLLSFISPPPGVFIGFGNSNFYLLPVSVTSFSHTPKIERVILNIVYKSYFISDKEKSKALS